MNSQLAQELLGAMTTLPTPSVARTDPRPSPITTSCFKTSRGVSFMEIVAYQTRDSTPEVPEFKIRAATLTIGNRPVSFIKKAEGWAQKKGAQSRSIFVERYEGLHRFLFSVWEDAESDRHGEATVHMSVPTGTDHIGHTIWSEWSEVDVPPLMLTSKDDSEIGRVVAAHLAAYRVPSYAAFDKLLSKNESWKPLSVRERWETIRTHYMQACLRLQLQVDAQKDHLFAIKRQMEMVRTAAARKAASEHASRVVRKANLELEPAPIEAAPTPVNIPTEADLGFDGSDDYEFEPVTSARADDYSHME